MLKNPKFYFIVLCILVVLTGTALFVVEKQKMNLPQDDTILTFQHPSWTDDMILEGENRIYRASMPSETASIVEKTGNSFTLAWDNWGTETFIKQPDGTYILQK